MSSEPPNIGLGWVRAQFPEAFTKDKRTQMAKTYDPACYELAEHFLKDEPFGNKDETSYAQACHDLALTIQQAVEDWFPATANEVRHGKAPFTG